ncbi:hypothetical protein SJAG_01603 [Schizosaccharomyces japonicus yFS275]|uniref:Uncharacterized protein n=1 Tax=Schizosaccharomyces japonicus (strain yFS275 / FY16936) TaxID=402676 RepID=B6JYE2_SCHJY|nr:hypothetical protein SJAG_01603 [Schizosaccharomyces japonicus yFS275]EEB06560.2 hypothetical protein SJAG_01603 [Schizosaccharomyces japonicus yFS275]
MCSLQILQINEQCLQKMQDAGQSHLRELWQVVTHCSSFVAAGYRLENALWRLWNSEASLLLQRKSLKTDPSSTASSNGQRTSSHCSDTPMDSRSIHQHSFNKFMAFYGTLDDDGSEHSLAFPKKQLNFSLHKNASPLRKDSKGLLSQDALEKSVVPSKSRIPSKSSAPPATIVPSNHQQHSAPKRPSASTAQMESLNSSVKKDVCSSSVLPNGRIHLSRRKTGPAVASQSSVKGNANAGSLPRRSSNVSLSAGRRQAARTRSSHNIRPARSNSPQKHNTPPAIVLEPNEVICGFEASAFTRPNSHLPRLRPLTPLVPTKSSMARLTERRPTSKQGATLAVPTHSSSPDKKLSHVSEQPTVSTNGHQKCVPPGHEDVPHKGMFYFQNSVSDDDVSGHSQSVAQDANTVDNVGNPNGLRAHETKSRNKQSTDAPNAARTSDNDDEWSSDSDSFEPHVFRKIDSSLERPSLHSHKSILSELLGSHSYKGSNVKLPAEFNETEINMEDDAVASSDDEADFDKDFPAIPMVSKRSFNIQHETSPEAVRRQMLSTELSESLKQSLLWDKQQKKKTSSAFLSRHLTSEVPQPQEFTDFNGNQVSSMKSFFQGDPASVW